MITARNSRMEENQWSLRTITGLFIYNANGFIQLNEHINKQREEFPEIYQDRDPKKKSGNFVRLELHCMKNLLLGSLHRDDEEIPRALQYI